MKEVTIELHLIDDWEALYVNGECWGQHHSRQLEEWFFDCFKEPVIILSTKKVYHEGDPVAEHVSEVACFPDTLEELNSL